MGEFMEKPLAEESQALINKAEQAVAKRQTQELTDKIYLEVLQDVARGETLTEVLPRYNIDMLYFQKLMKFHPELKQKIDIAKKCRAEAIHEDLISWANIAKNEDKLARTAVSVLEKEVARHTEPLESEDSAGKNQGVIVVNPFVSEKKKDVDVRTIDEGYDGDEL